ncbi:anti-lipopolysaccharide factor isoform X2 [Procambarus clarkii]|uniref:ALF1 n=1 Tax=Procambarus clarkii TaxID=6728 RepID=A0A1S5RQT3_PROCL|nr:anti-lipopolysaccharide factor-like isoform X2 [Procambarus clarkii]XP_045608932.1 anti-lipopolysaccharide factor-like isoform X2 [Procambarus clarkii]AOG75594.1 ALF1 [Procambarus clarkii]
MRSWTLLTVMSLMMMVVLQQPCQAQVSPELINLIINKLGGLWKDGEVEFMGRACNYSYSPKISGWRLYYKGKMWCPGWAPFSGDSQTKSRAGAIEHATRDFVRKAIENKLITAEEAAAWLKQ